MGQISSTIVRPTEFLEPFRAFQKPGPLSSSSEKMGLDPETFIEDFETTLSRPKKRPTDFLEPFQELGPLSNSKEKMRLEIDTFLDKFDVSFNAKARPTGFPEPFQEFPSAKAKPDTLDFLETDSAYSTQQNTPETEFPSNSLDWTLLSKELDGLVLTSTPLVPKVLEPQGTNFTFSDCVFVIEGMGSKTVEDDGFEDCPSILDIQIVGPSGQLCPIEFDAYYDSLRCTFRPVEIGLHHGKVLSEGKHVQGSPFITIICRDYENATEKWNPVVSMDIELTSIFEEDSLSLEIKKPWGIACISKTEQIVVADRENHEILVFKPDGELDFTFGKRGTGHGEFFRPTSVAYDPINEKIYVGDKDNHRIQTFTNKGEYLSSFGCRGYRVGQLMYPWGLAVSKCGELIVVADTRNHRIQLFTAGGRFLRQYPVRPNKNEFNHPRGVAFDLTGENIYVSDFNLNCIFKVDISFNECTKIVDESVLRRPQGLAIDEAGNLLVADSRHNSIKVFLPSGAFLQEFSKLSKSVFMDLPLDLSVMPAGFLAVLDLNGRVNVI